MVRAKPLTLALWLPSVPRGQAPGRGREVPTNTSTVPRHFPMAFSVFPTPTRPCPSPCGATRVQVGFIWLAKSLVGVGVQWWAWWEHSDGTAGMPGGAR